jgi:hypothetical protein
VAYNLNKQPYFLVTFNSSDLKNIEQINCNFQNKSKEKQCINLSLGIKDDYVPDCLLYFPPLIATPDIGYN